MMKLLTTLAVLTLFAGAAFGQANEIGIYTTQDANPENTSYNGAPGQITAYVVCSNPTNFHYGSPTSDIVNPITVVGGFEFRLEVPANVFLLAAAMPPQSTNFATSPEWLAGTNAPVTDGNVTLLTLTLGEFGGTPSSIYLSPVVVAPQSIPGMMAITDYADDFRLNPAYPVSGSYDLPVFGLWTSVVDSEDASWGEVKSLYR